MRCQGVMGTTESMNAAKTVFADLEFATGAKAKQPPYLKEDFVSLYTAEQFAAWLENSNERLRKNEEKK